MLLPECLDDFIDESNPVRVIDVFVDALDLADAKGGGGHWRHHRPKLRSDPAACFGALIDV